MTKRLNYLSIAMLLAVGISAVYIEESKAYGCSGKGNSSCKTEPSSRSKRRDRTTEVCTLDVAKDLSIGRDLTVDRDAWTKGTINVGDIKVKCGKNKVRTLLGCEKCLKNTRGTIGLRFDPTTGEIVGVVERGKGFSLKPVEFFCPAGEVAIPVCYEKTCKCDDASTVVCSIEGPNVPELASLGCFVTNAEDNPNGFKIVLVGLCQNAGLLEQFRINFVAQCPGC